MNFPLTHYTEDDAASDRQLVRALCHRQIYRREHDEAPTCAICQQRLAARERVQV